MATVLGIADYVVIATVMSISAGVGVYFRFTGGKQKTTLEFLMADKNMSVLPVSFSILATLMSAISLLGTPVEAYLYGAQKFLGSLSYPVAVIIVAYCVLPVYFEINANSVYEYLGRRFGQITKIIVSVLFSVQMILYMPIVMYAPSLALSTLTGLSVWTSVVSISLICSFYSTLGGLKAVLWTDLFQGFLMLLTVYSLLVKGAVDFGGFQKILETAYTGQRLELFNTSTDFTVRYTVWNVMLSGIVFGLNLNGTNFSIIQRLFSCGSLKKAQRSLLWSIPLYLIFQFGVHTLGITMYSYYNECDPIGNQEIEKGDQIVLLFILNLFGHLPGLPGLCVAGIFSAALSTMSSIINSLAAVTLEDYLESFTRCKRLKESTKSLVVKLLALFYGGLCLSLTFVIANVKGLIEATAIILGMVGGPTCGVFCLGLFTATANQPGAIVGLITGFAVNAWIGFGSLYSKYRYPPLPLSTEGCSTNVTIYNTTYASDMNTTSSIIQSTNDGYIFPLYKISFVWLTVISFVLTVIAGYTASFIIGFWRTKTDIPPQLFSPLVRKWLCKSSRKKETKEYVEISQVLN